MAKDKGKCKVKFCRRFVTHRWDLCNTCYSRIWREKNPQKAAYSNLRNNARRRGISFEITYDMFLKFSEETKYIFGKGRKKESLTIDRIDETIGYVEGNLQTLTNSENVKKQHKTKRKKNLKYSEDEKGIPYNFRFEGYDPPDLSDSPF